MARNRKNSKKRGIMVRRGLIIGAIIIAIAIIGVLLYIYLPKLAKPNADAIAFVNGEPILVKEFNDLKSRVASSQISVTDEIILDQLITQKLLLQEAKKAGIKITDDDFKAYVDSYLVEKNIDEAALKSAIEMQNMTYDEFKSSTMEQLAMLKYVNKTIMSKVVVTEEMMQNLYQQSGTNMTYESVKDQIKQVLELQMIQTNMNQLIDDLKKGAKIEIVNKTVDINESFAQTGQELCSIDGKPVVRLFTADNCEPCQWIGEEFDAIAKEYSDRIIAHHWNLNTGDDALTAETENAVPQAEKDLFLQLNPKKGIPTIIAGCKYIRIGTTHTKDQIDIERQLIKGIFDSLIKEVQ